MRDTATAPPGPASHSTVPLRLNITRAGTLRLNGLLSRGFQERLKGYKIIQAENHPCGRRDDGPRWSRLQLTAGLRRRRRLSQSPRSSLLSHLRSYERYDEPETLPSSIHPFCPISADGGQGPLEERRRRPVHKIGSLRCLPRADRRVRAGSFSHAPACGPRNMGPVKNLLRFTTATAIIDEGVSAARSGAKLPSRGVVDRSASSRRCRAWIVSIGRRHL